MRLCCSEVGAVPSDADAIRGAVCVTLAVTGPQCLSSGRCKYRLPASWSSLWFILAVIMPKRERGSRLLFGYSVYLSSKSRINAYFILIICPFQKWVGFLSHPDGQLVVILRCHFKLVLFNDVQIVASFDSRSLSWHFETWCSLPWEFMLPVLLPCVV